MWGTVIKAGSLGRICTIGGIKLYQKVNTYNTKR